ncbi:hypothetical protein MXB_3744, partial [Myxobolus squamalis]
IFRSNRRISFYIPSQNSFYDDKYKSEQSIFQLSKIGKNGDSKITPNDTLIKPHNLTLDENIEPPIIDMVNFMEIQNRIKNIRDTCLNGVTRFFDPTKIPDIHAPFANLPNSISVPNIPYLACSDFTHQPTVLLRKKRKQAQPILFEVSDMFLKWNNKHKPPKTDAYPILPDQIHIPSKIEAENYPEISSEPIPNDQICFNPILMNPNSYDPSLLKQIILDTSNNHPITEHPTITSLPQTSNIAFGNDSKNFDIEELIPINIESTNFSIITKKEDYFQFSEPIWLTEYMVETNDVYFYIFSHPIETGDFDFGSKHTENEEIYTFSKL